MVLVRDPAPSRIPVFESYIHMFDTSIFDGYTRLYHGIFTNTRNPSGYPNLTHPDVLK